MLRLMNFFIVTTLISGIAFMADAKDNELPAGFTIAPIPTSDYYDKAIEVGKIRTEREVSFKQTADMLKDKNTILLDTRGDAEYARIHVRGAKHLSYADMTVDKLAAMFPDKNKRIILYCDAALQTMATRMMPLSTNAFVDMYLYGYSNLYEVRALYKSQPNNAQCQEVMDTEFEGDAEAIAALKQQAMQCLSGN